MKCVLSSVASCVHVEVREASMPGSECRCMDVGGHDCGNIASTKACHGWSRRPVHAMPSL